MASSPAQVDQKPAAGSASKRKVKFAGGNLRIDTHAHHKQDGPSCEPVRGSPATTTTTPPVPAKSGKRSEKGPESVPMDALLAPKSTAFTPPLPFRRGEPAWRPPRFVRGSRPRCPEKLDLSTIPRRRFMRNGRRVYAARGTATLPPPVIPAEVPLAKAPATHAPKAKASKAKVPTDAVPPAQVSPMKASSENTAPGIASTSAKPTRMPFPGPQSPVYSPSSDSMPEIATRQNRRRRQNGESHARVNQGRRSPVPVTRRNRRNEQQRDSLVRRREARDECSCTLCEDCCLILTTLGVGMTVLLSVSAAISEAGQWLASLIPPEEYTR